MLTEQTTTTRIALDGEWRDRCAIPDHVLWGPGSYKRLRGKIDELGCGRVLLLTSGSLRKRTPWVDRIQEELGHLVVLTRSDSQEFTAGLALFRHSGAGACCGTRCHRDRGRWQRG